MAGYQDVTLCIKLLLDGMAAMYRFKNFNQAMRIVIYEHGFRRTLYHYFENHEAYKYDRNPDMYDNYLAHSGCYSLFEAYGHCIYPGQFSGWFTAEIDRLIDV